MAGVEQDQHAAVLAQFGQFASQLFDRQSGGLDARVVARIDLVGQQIELAVDQRAVAREVDHREIVAASALHRRSHGLQRPQNAVLLASLSSSTVGFTR